jgi:sortase A
VKRILLIVFAILLLLAAVLFAAYPIISNYVNDKYQSVVRTDYEEEVRELDDTALREMRAEAEAYNASLSPVQYDKNGIELASTDYHDLLNPTGSEIMGYIEIPKINVDLPIYHGTSEKVLEEGVGHLIGSSLPVGGEGTHTVLTGHSGVAEQKLFSDIDQLTAGDVFYIKVLGETMAYEVVEVNTVLPHETELLELIHGEDLATLITCTPFGVNSHRLLVRGSRIPYQEAEKIVEKTKTEQTEPVKSTWKEQYLVGLKYGGAIAAACLLIFIIVVLRRKKRRGASKHA